MIKLSQIQKIIKKTILVYNFNVEEYQDKYYFRKKLQEILPELDDLTIYNAINNYLNTYKVFSNGTIDELGNEIYKQYLAKAK